MGEDKLCIGMVAGLDTTDATFSCHDLLQQLKTHPFVRDLLEGGKRVGWGAKTIPSGGYWSMPKQLAVPGMVMCGDNVSMVNIPYLKGIHYAMHAGMYAAEAIVESLKADPESVDFSAYEDEGPQVRDREGPLQVAQRPPARRQGLRRRSARSPTPGCSRAARCPRRPLEDRGRRRGRDAHRQGRRRATPSPTASYTFDKLASVFLSGNATRDDAPNHVRSRRHVPREVAQTWVSMCPAQVYEIPEDQLESGAAEVDVHVTASNCVQCGAITAKGGRLTMPEGGDGPLYQET